jgi:hypothetical protein
MRFIHASAVLAAVLLFGAARRTLNAASLALVLPKVEPDACALLTEAEVSKALEVKSLPGKRIVAESPKACAWSDVPNGDISQHARRDDLVIVKSRTGAIEMGDSLVGSEFRAMGERIGGKFHRSYRIVVHTGDIVRIPAVVPHAFIVSGKEPLDYLVIKQQREGLPIRWKEDR